MAWTVKIDDEVAAEIEGWPSEAQEELASRLVVLQKYGPQLGRPYVDQLKGSRYPNLKELRFSTSDGGIWRVVFAFDPHRCAVVVAGGDKKGKDEQRFLSKAD